MTKVRSDFRVRARGSNSKIRVRGVARLRGVMLVKPLVLTLKSDLIWDIGPGLMTPISSSKIFRENVDSSFIYPTIIS